MCIRDRGYTVKFQKIATMRTLEDALANVSDRLKQKGGSKEPAPNENYTPPLKKRQLKHFRGV
jgi:hypothetical protein